MTPEDRDKIRKWAEIAAAPLPLTLAAGKGPEALAMREFAEDLASLWPAVPVKRDDEPASGPALRLNANISFQSVPGARELAPFLAALSDGPALAALVPAPLAERARSIKLPALFSVFVQNTCPHCPPAVMKLLGLAFAAPAVHVAIIDAGLFPDKAAQSRVKAAPTTILDGGLRFVGALDLSELVSVVENRDPAALSAETLTALIADGQAPRLAGMMVEAGRLFPAFFTVLAHDKWPVRLGAMVAFEYLAEGAPALAAQAAETLVSLFGEAPDPVRGDLLHSLAQTGRKDMLPWLSGVAEGPYPEEVREAAAEAAEELEGS